MNKKIFRKLIQFDFFKKLIFLVYYSHVINITITTLALKKKLNENNKLSKLLFYTIKVDTSSSLTNTPVSSDIYINKQAIAALEEKCTFVPEYKSPLRIMLLGDSITYGVKGISDMDSGGYRTELWQKFVADGLPTQFVGSRCHGPNELGDKTHEGHPGWTIKQISASVSQWLDAAQPDLILLMIGTNDTRKSSLRTMIEDVNTLIDKISARCPNAQLLVASIPPIHPAAKPAIRSLRAMYFNAAIPSIVSSKIAQGQKVHFVDMRSLSVQDLTASLSLDLDCGLHPNAQGYRKIASFWHDAVFKVVSNSRHLTITSSRISF
ncbi:SGNH/GDSL hydrolase family protein [Gloeocapsa sp. BRSZ]